MFPWVSFLGMVFKSTKYVCQEGSVYLTAMEQIEIEVATIPPGGQAIRRAYLMRTLAERCDAIRNPPVIRQWRPFSDYIPAIVVAMFVVYAIFSSL